jgi:hypothetical protein
MEGGTKYALRHAVRSWRRTCALPPSRRCRVVGSRQVFLSTSARSASSPRPLPSIHTSWLTPMPAGVGQMLFGLCKAGVRRSNTAKPKALPSNGRSSSDCAGSSKEPTRGCRTTGNSAATPTAEHGTDTHNTASSPRHSSPQNSSTGATDGAPTHALSARPLSGQLSGE